MGCHLTGQKKWFYQFYKCLAPGRHMQFVAFIKEADHKAKLNLYY